MCVCEPGERVSESTMWLKAGQGTTLHWELSALTGHWERLRDSTQTQRHKVLGICTLVQYMLFASTKETATVYILFITFIIPLSCLSLNHSSFNQTSNKIWYSKYKERYDTQIYFNKERRIKNNHIVHYLFTTFSLARVIFEIRYIFSS